MSVPTEAQIAKLPRWAREYIRTLEYATHDAQRKHSELFDEQEKTGILFGDVYENPRYLPESGYGRVRYHTSTEKNVWDEYSYLEFSRPTDQYGRIGKGGIQVTSSDGIEIIPVVSNVVIIKSVRNR
ncbi:hypothetical protein SEA_MASELOP_76 [Rhodococcus phage Maselop]|nr:hypothetical protein SEA_BRAXOADDIE_76 [Rhodococcus phage Braxoaddie]WNM64999.1 hypothetical protein SEA_MASELOP_76 [Rhodococcus phage Maselop]WNM67460.1 hypothetical protein SEA_POLYYUKI_76 [Rhodococcus phage Polyyuki]